MTKIIILLSLRNDQFLPFNTTIIYIFTTKKKKKKIINNKHVAFNSSDKCSVKTLKFNVNLLARQSNKSWSRFFFQIYSISLTTRTAEEASVSRCLVHAGPGKKEFHSIAVNGASVRNWRHSRAALHEERMKLLESFASFSPLTLVLSPRRLPC